MWYSRLKTKAASIAAITTLLLSPAFSYAQDNYPFNCGTDQYWQEQVRDNPQLHEAREKMLEQINEKKASGKLSLRSEKKIIPVVFHVIHTYGPENISRQKVLDQIKALNEQYSATNPDISSVRDMYKDLIGTPNVEFRLATKDPQGNCTDGIIRKYSTLTENARDNVKGLSYWDANKYLNVWVVSTINNFGGQGTVLGFAQFPWAGSHSTDGIVIRADQVAYGNETLAHEVGHFLGLLHTFESYAGDGCGNSCSSSGDRICDTPPSTGPSWGCPAATYNTCTLDNPDQPDMWENFMDYSSCQHMFTQGQVMQMQAVFVDTKRANLITAGNLIATGTNDNAAATNCTPVADFYTTKNMICEGGTIYLQDNTYNGTPSSYLWTFENGTPNTSTAKDPSVKFTKAGTYRVRLKVSNTSGSNEIEKDEFIVVLPAVSENKTPIGEDFESFDESKYKFDETGLKWTLSDKAATSGTKSIWLDNSLGKTDQSYLFTLPMVDMTTATETKLRFRMAFAQKSSTSNDELRVQVSTSCGQNFNTVYYKFGSSLATTSQYYTSTFIPTAGEWRDVEINLGSYSTVKNLLVRFNMENRGGNDIFIDDIFLGGTPTTSIEPDERKTGIALYPNPSTGTVNLSVTGVPAGPGQVEIYDMAGKRLQQINDLRLGDGTNAMQLTASDMNLGGAGVYLIKITVGPNAFVRKLVITE